jgi:GNAT superfamily N-acetyltransferase
MNPGPTPAAPFVPEPVTLRDGTPLIIRPIRPDDAPRLQAFHTRLLPESIYLRYLGPHPVLTAREAERLTNVDYAARMALAATRSEGEGETIVGVARYDALGPARPDEAEAAIVVEDRYQSRGLGALLMSRLLAYARTHGLRYFVAEVSDENDRLMRFVQRSGLPAEKKLKEGVWEIRVNIA